MSENDVFLHDRFVSGTPPSSLSIRLPLDSFTTAVENVYQFSQYTEQGVYFAPKNTPFTPISNELRRTKIKEIAAELVGEFGVQLSVSVHRDMCIKLISSGSDLSMLLDLLAYDISTDHVIPSRQLLRESLLDFFDRESVSIGLLDLTIRAWQELAVYARLASVRKRVDLSELARKFDKAGVRESKLWESILND
ncbi:hypothetical protein [Pseudomonas peli]|uniref:hypothetical protein n=1 Tax=Pseudomonas peli TaxID=592361 RepID=UPI0024AD6AD2|nr:hypothetical protein [Pseudomonas peli]